MVFKELERSDWINKRGYDYNVREQLKRYIQRRSEQAFDKGDAKRDALIDIESFEKHRAYMRDRFIESMGGIPGTDSPLNARCTGIVNGDGFRIEKIIFESRPGTYVTTNLYVPDEVTEPRAAVIFVCGHYNEAKSHPEYQTVCQYLVHTGLIVLAVDPIGQGERSSYYEKSLGREAVRPGTMDHNYAGFMCLLLRQSIGRYFLHDIMRSIDYLYSRPEVDKDKIGITGNSGGRRPVRPCNDMRTQDICGCTCKLYHEQTDLYVRGSDPGHGTDIPGHVGDRVRP